MTPEKWQKYLDAAFYTPSMTSLNADRRKEAKEYIEYAFRGAGKGESILILGCGDGYEVKIAYEMGYEAVQGFTGDKYEYESSQKQKIEGITFGDMHELPYEDESFSLIVSKETLEHAMSPWIALCELNRVLKTGGSMVHLIPSGMAKQRDWYHYHCPPPWVWVDLFLKTGHKVDQLEEKLEQWAYWTTKTRELSLDEPYEMINLEEYMKELGYETGNDQ